MIDSDTKILNSADIDQLKNGTDFCLYCSRDLVHIFPRNSHIEKNCHKHFFLKPFKLSKDSHQSDL